MRYCPSYLVSTLVASPDTSRCRRRQESDRWFPKRPGLSRTATRWLRRSRKSTAGRRAAISNCDVHHGLFDATWLHGHENHELVAASRATSPTSPTTEFRRRPDCHQHPITFCVTQIVVDALERIDIDHHRKDYVSLEFADTEQLLPDIVQPTSIQGSGEWIAPRVSCVVGQIQTRKCTVIEAEAITHPMTNPVDTDSEESVSGSVTARIVSSATTNSAPVICAVTIRGLWNTDE